MDTKELISNKVAFFNYEILDTFEAGIVLKGTEIKSLRDGGGNLRDNYVQIKNFEAFLHNVSIAPFKFGNIHNHEELRIRKLLLHKDEIIKLKKLTEIKGHTLVALSFYLKKGRVKVKVGVCRGKKTHDKREDLKKKSQMRDIAQAIKNSN
jgi:SsrA-binding protein